MAPLAASAVTAVEQVCSGNGRCMSLRDLSLYEDYSTGYYGASEYTGWDADMMYGCVCDSGWEGMDCSKKSCPKGFDPLSTGVNEIQLIECKCTKCTGGLYITLNGEQTPLIPYDATEEVIAYRLQVQYER